MMLTLAAHLKISQEVSRTHRRASFRFEFELG